MTCCALRAEAAGKAGADWAGECRRDLATAEGKERGRKRKSGFKFLNCWFR